MIKRTAMPRNNGSTTQRPRNTPEPYAAKPCNIFSYSLEAISPKILKATRLIIGLRFVEKKPIPSYAKRANAHMSFCCKSTGYTKPALAVAPLI